jgi:hypothetical protein
MISIQWRLFAPSGATRFELLKANLLRSAGLQPTWTTLIATSLNLKGLASE